MLCSRRRAKPGAFQTPPDENNFTVFGLLETDAAHHLIEARVRAQVVEQGIDA